MPADVEIENGRMVKRDGRDPRARRKFELTRPASAIGSRVWPSTSADPHVRNEMELMSRRSRLSSLRTECCKRRRRERLIAPHLILAKYHRFPFFSFKPLHDPSNPAHHSGHIDQETAIPSTVRSCFNPLQSSGHHGAKAEGDLACPTIAVAIEEAANRWRIRSFAPGRKGIFKSIALFPRR